MHKKAVVFIWVTGLIFLLAFYGQLILMENDVRTYVSQSQSTFKSPEADEIKQKYHIIPMDVRETSTIYVSYKGEVQGNGHTFRILDMDNNALISETGESIHVFKEKLQLEKGRYQVVIDIDHIESMNRKYRIVYRKEDVAFPKTNEDN